MQSVYTLKDDVSNNYNFQQQLLFAPRSNHRYSDKTQVSAVTSRTELLSELLKSMLKFIMSLDSFYTPWKHLKTRLPHVFRGYRKRAVAWNGLRTWLILY